MKYMLISTAAFIICLAIAWIAARRIRKSKGLKRLTTFFLTIGFTLVLLCAASIGYFNVYYHADASAETPVDGVLMSEIDGGYFFDGPGADSALIFYPGAKVDTMAYAPLMNALAENGVDCFLADLPFRMAMFGGSRADSFLNHYHYDHWACAGHSMGGLVISGYAAKHADRVGDLILLASYPETDIPDSISLCSIYGDRDGCLSMELYEQARTYWPANSTEHILKGGNHAQYADYGPQSGDAEPEITREEQQSLTVELILQAMDILPA